MTGAGHLVGRTTAYTLPQAIFAEQRNQYLLIGMGAAGLDESTALLFSHLTQTPLARIITACPSYGSAICR